MIKERDYQPYLTTNRLGLAKLWIDLIKINKFSCFQHPGFISIWQFFQTAYYSKPLLFKIHTI